MSTLAKLALAMLAVAVSGVMTKAQSAESIVGTWRLVSWIEEETESKAVHKNFGDNPAQVENARLRLAEAMLSIAAEGSTDVAVLKASALEAMAMEYRSAIRPLLSSEIQAARRERHQRTSRPQNDNQKE